MEIFNEKPFQETTIPNHLGLTLDANLDLQETSKQGLQGDLYLDIVEIFNKKPFQETPIQNHLGLTLDANLEPSRVDIRC